DDREQVVVGNLVHQLLDGEVADARPEGLGLPPAVFAVTPGAVPEEELLAAHRVPGPTLRGARRRRHQRRAHEADEKRTLEKRRRSRFAKRNRGLPPRSGGSIFSLAGVDKPPQGRGMRPPPRSRPARLRLVPPPH